MSLSKSVQPQVCSLKSYSDSADNAVNSLWNAYSLKYPTVSIFPFPYILNTMKLKNHDVFWFIIILLFLQILLGMK